LFEPDFDPNLASFELFDPKKSNIDHQFFVRILTLFDLSDSNLTQIRIFTSATGRGQR